MSSVRFHFSSLTKKSFFLFSYPNGVLFKRDWFFIYNINTIQIILFTQMKLPAFGNTTNFSPIKDPDKAWYLCFVYRGFSVDTILGFISVVCYMGLRWIDRVEPTINCPYIVFCIFMVFMICGMEFENLIRVFILTLHFA